MDQRPRRSPISDVGTALTDVETDSLRASLIAEQHRVRAQIDQLARSFDDIVAAVEMSNSDDEHDPEGATIAFERAQVAALLLQARADLGAIEASLTRLDDGVFGLCDSCARPIGSERLDAVPSTVVCIECA